MSPQKTFKALRPSALEDLAEDAYTRRRGADLTRATTATVARSARRPRRRPTLLIAGVAAGAVVAAGGAIALTGDDGAGPRRQTPAASPSLNVRTFLLASAQNAERVPVTTGRWWYTRERTTQVIDQVFKPNRRKVAEKLPFAATVSHSQDSWWARSAKDTTRIVRGIDYRTDFATPAERAKWKAMGSPDFKVVGPSKPSVNNYHESFRYSIGQKQLTFGQFAKLPTDTAGMENELRRRYQADVNDPRFPLEGTFADYVWSTAQDLLAGPLSPGTRAALYRVLAKQPGLVMVGKVTDPLGRPGIAVATTDIPRFAAAEIAQKVGRTSVGNGEEMNYRLIVDEGTGRLLARQVVVGAKPRLTVAYEAMGWTDTLGGRP